MNSFAELGTTGNRHEGQYREGHWRHMFLDVVKRNNGDIVNTKHTVESDMTFVITTQTTKDISENIVLSHD